MLGKPTNITDVLNDDFNSNELAMGLKIVETLALEIFNSQDWCAKASLIAVSIEPICYRILSDAPE